MKRLAARLPETSDPSGGPLGGIGAAARGKDRLADLVLLRELIEAGEVTPVLDRTYPLAEAAAAIEDVRRGRVRGHAVVTP
ncbi:zinc-binding dehydrogenase [Saccharothrix stipae]